MLYFAKTCNPFHFFLFRHTKIQYTFSSRIYQYSTTSHGAHKPFISLALLLQRPVPFPDLGKHDWQLWSSHAANSDYLKTGEPGVIIQFIFNISTYGLSKQYPENTRSY